VCFALSEMGVEGVGGGFYRRAGVLGGGGGGGVVVMEQVTRGIRCDKGKVGLLPMTMAVNALQRGSRAVVVRMEVGTRAGGTGEWWGQ
jgi:hypothetical protein